jgi:hypothetical protein
MGNQPAALVWPLEPWVPLTTPRATELTSAGFGVTARIGGQSGAIHFGWLSATGEKQTDFQALPSDAQALGTPGVVNSPSEALLTYVARPTQQSPFQLQLAKATFGTIPQAVKSWDSSVERISPTAAPLPDGHWLLQWSEGKSGDRSIMVQVINSDLDALGEPISLSPSGVDAGMGTLWLKNGLGVSLFLVRTQTNFELWATGLACE